MKKIVLALAATAFSLSLAAQEDTTKKTADTIRVGGMVIVKQKGKNEESESQKRERRKKSKISTNWFIVDLGFSNFEDKTNYASAEAQAFAPGLDKDDFKIRTAKSINVNIWLFMQRRSLVKNVLNLKYGLGIELNNYRFETRELQLGMNPTQPSINPAWTNLVKNKLAADYLTVPLMLNVNFTPSSRRSFGFSAGVSAGYLYSARQKIKDNDGNKTKYYSDFDLRPFKFSYIAELNLGPVKLYGSYALKSMWAKGLNQVPYTLGFRLSHW